MQQEDRDWARRIPKNGYLLSSVLAWAFRAAILAIILWLRSEFVTKDQYLKDQSKSLEELVKIGKTLTHIDDQLDTAAKVNDDHEKRLRELEKVDGARKR